MKINNKLVKEILLLTLPNKVFQISSVSLCSAVFIKSHQQLHYNVCQVTVDQAVNLLQNKSFKRQQKLLF